MLGLLSFGVAPACLARAVGFTGAWDTAVLLFFVACGTSRLARYNVTAPMKDDVPVTREPDAMVAARG